MMWQHASNPESASGRHVFLGTYPPRQCGIATFTKDLIDAFDGATGGFSDVIAVDDASGRRYPYSGRVVRKLAQNERSSYRQTARYIDASEYQTLNIQHEFGIFGGADGRWLLDLMDETRKPVVLTMHTVLPSPSPAHKALVSRLCALAARTVVLSRTAKRLLVSRYGVDPDAVRTIPHGIPDVRFAPTAEFKRSLGFEHRFVVSTFGLLSRGKGLETAIDAIAQAVRSVPNIVYLILGATHPVVARDEGESYREELQARIQSSGIDRNVRMVDRYLNVPELLLYLSSTDAYVTPYVNPDQIVSGTLAYAAGSGRAIVSTPYLYARELLSGERGIIVPFGDSASMAAAITKLASDDALRLAIAKRAYDQGREMIWPVVGEAYARVVADVRSPEFAYTRQAG